MGVSPETFEGEGRTIEEATRAACAAAGLDPDAALVEVVSEGGVAVAGERVSGARAKVRVEATSAEGLKGKRHLETLLKLMDIEAQVRLRRPRPAEPAWGSEPGGPPLLLEVEGVDLGILIGWRGESLRGLQTVLNLMLGPSGLAPGAPRLIVDVARYRQRRGQTVANLAVRMAAGVARSGRPVTLEPMPPYERRAVHLALAGDPSVASESSGTDAERRVTIRPAGEARL
jgi:spoIIIJ-associated protein